MLLFLLLPAFIAVGHAAPWQKPSSEQLHATEPTSSLNSSLDSIPSRLHQHIASPVPLVRKSTKNTHAVENAGTFGTLMPSSNPGGNSVVVPISTSKTTATTTISMTDNAAPTIVDACAEVGRRQAESDLDSAIVPAELAYNCLISIPFNQSAALLLLESIRPYLNWQTTITNLKSPPAEFAEKVQPAYDFWAEFETVNIKAKLGAYGSEYEFGYELYLAFQQTHDSHFNFFPDSVAKLFTFTRSASLVSVSMDGKSLPQVYAHADILEQPYNSSPITHIDGKNVTEFLLNWSRYSSLQDRDALWNDLFFDHSPGGTYGSFAGKELAEYIYPGPSTRLDFANGSSVSKKNFAVVHVDFDGIESGADVYQQYFASPPNATDNILKILTSNNSDALDFHSSIDPDIEQREDSRNKIEFIDEPGYEDIAVLSVPKFRGIVDEELLQSATKAKKSKLIIDVSANSGGKIYAGFELFKQLFPSTLPYHIFRMHAHEAFNLLGQEYSRPNEDLEMPADEFNYRNDLDVSYQPFTSWADVYGPHELRLANDNSTSAICANGTGPLLLDDHMDDHMDNLTPPKIIRNPFSRDNVVIVSDGTCGSTCFLFCESMRQQAGIKTIALGGRPNYDNMQAVGGVKGAQVYKYKTILAYVRDVFKAGSPEQRKYWNESTPLGNYNMLPILRSVSARVNYKDAFRRDDLNTPLQFRLENADCRIFYTPDMFIDQEMMWKTVADTVWGDKDYCIAGSNEFYGKHDRKTRVL